MTEPESPLPLSPEDAALLADFARACKATARVVALYPATHPAIQSSLARVADGARRLRRDRALTLAALPHTILLDGRAAAKPEAALGELAELLHQHSLATMTVTGDLSADAWYTFLSLLARTPDDVHEHGGLAKLWAAAGVPHLDVRQIDYAEVLRERQGTDRAARDAVVSRCLGDDGRSLDDALLSDVLAMAEDEESFRAFVAQLAETWAAADRAEPDRVVRVIQALVAYVAREHPGERERLLATIAGAIPLLTPEQVTMLFASGEGTEPHVPTGQASATLLRSRVSDQIAAEFVAQALAKDWGATERLAQAFQALVPDTAERGQILELAKAELDDSPAGHTPGFGNLWQTAVDMLTSYSDASYVPDDYGRELAAARAQAVDIDQISDDPPERISAWLATLEAGAVSQLGHQLFVDLLAIEARDDVWASLLESALPQIEEEVAGGRVREATTLIEVIVRSAGRDEPIGLLARDGLDRLRKGPLAGHVIAAARSASEDDTAALSELCGALGPELIGPLLDQADKDPQPPVKWLREVILGCGAASKEYAAPLQASSNAGLRRTAVEVLTAHGGPDAMPRLTALLKDPEPSVQRAAARAVAEIASPDAISTLAEALRSGSPAARESLVRALSASRHPGVSLLFVHVLRDTEPRGPLEPLYLQAIDALGRTGGDDASIAALAAVLRRGEWWAPRRTARLRHAAAHALRATGAPAALEVLTHAARSGSRGVRRAVETALRVTETRRAD
ncbi:MAG: HEAT repeat domain-containing protein [Acidobacteriota bacterium]